MSEHFQNLYDINTFVDQALEYINLERDEEDKIAKNIIGNNTNKYLEEKGILLTNMKIVEVTRGLYGRLIVVLEKNNSSTLPSHKFTPGDAVAIITKDMKRNFSSSSSNDEKQSFIRGLVYRIAPSKIVITLAQKNENEEMYLSDDIRTVSIAMIGNDVTFKRMEIALKKLLNLNQENNLSVPLKCLFDPTMTNVELIESDVNDFKNFNESQIEAIKFSLKSQNFALIHGPPGTGKTTTVVEFIYRSVLEGKKVLACAPSNIAVDNLVDKLSKYNISIVRIGHPARILESTLLYCLDDLYVDTNDYEVTKTMREDMKKKEKEIRETSEAWKRKQMWKEFRETKDELKRRETIGLKRVIESANVVLSTCVGADDRTLRDAHFDVVVVDEAGQGVDPVVLIPILKGNKVVLAGDHLQLPPTIKSTIAVQKKLCTSTFFERVITTKPYFSKILKVQYRMNEKIMNYSSKALYNNELIADVTVKDHTLYDLQSIKDNEVIGMDEDLVKNPLIFVDTAGCSMYEVGDDGESKYNESEADVVVKIVEKLLACGLEENQIGVISPYNAQVDLIKSKVRAVVKNRPIEIHSVDSFQGREKEAIIISLVRSNNKREVGFLNLDNRMNVAFTRARRLLLVIGDSETLCAHAFLKNFIDFCDTEGEYWSAQEFLIDETPIDSPKTISNTSIIEHHHLKSTEQKEKQRKPQNHPKKAIVKPKIKVKQTQSQKPSTVVHESISKDETTEQKTIERRETNKIQNVKKKQTGPKQQNPVKKTAKKTAKKAQTKAEKALKDIEDEDELLDYFGKQSQKCGLYGCNQSVRLLSEICKYCKEKFCMSHVIPELHGCGEEASKQQKEQYMKGTQKKSTPSWQKEALKTKLQKKIESTKGKRTKAPNDKKKK